MAAGMLVAAAVDLSPFLASPIRASPAAGIHNLAGGGGMTAREVDLCIRGDI